MKTAKDLASMVIARDKMKERSDKMNKTSSIVKAAAKKLGSDIKGGIKRVAVRALDNLESKNTTQAEQMMRSRPAIQKSIDKSMGK